MPGYPIWIALVLAIWAYIGIVTTLGPGLWWQEALISGFVTGVIVGNIPLGLTVGASLTLLSLGLWTYGGATIPDFQTGAIVGTAVGALGGGFAAGFAIALPTALLMSMLPLRRYWPFLLIGFVLFAYLSVPIIGITILAVAIGFLVNMVQTRSAVNV